jgi:Tol biopolymer transport system component
VAQAKPIIMTLAQTPSRRTWLALSALTVLVSACGSSATVTLVPPPATRPAPAAAVSPAPAGTSDPYTLFAQNLKAAVEGNDEAALRSLVGLPWYAGRYKADITEYKNVADAVAGFRAIRTRITIAVDLNAAGTQPAGTQKPGERIVVARVQPGNGSEEPAFLYAGRMGGEWRWVAFITGMPAEMVSILPTVAPAVNLPGNATAMPAAGAVSTGLPSPSVPGGSADLVFARRGSILIHDMGDNHDAVLLDRPQVSQWDWSHDGTRAAFIMGGPQQFQIWRVSRDGSSLQALSENGRYSNPRWSPDGTLILYGYNASGATNKDEIWLMASDGSNKHKLADGFEAAWAPDGQRIAFASVPSSTVGPVGSSLPARNGIHIINVFGKNEWTPIATNTASPKFTPLEWQMSQARLVDAPQWSPDGNEITLRVQDGHGAYVTTNATTGGFGKFVALYFDGAARGFSYSPNGKHITVGTGGQSGFETIGIFLRGELGKDGISGTPFRTLGKVPKLAGDVPQSVTGFVWSPDGTQIAYALDKGGVWVMDIGAGSSVQLSADGAGPLFWLP